MPKIVEPTPEAVASAAARLRAGGVVVFPTETVYGLGASTFSVEGLDAVYAIKQRPADNPLIAHVLGATGARRVALDWDDRCELLAKRFWPGPLTLVLHKSPDVPPRATAGLDTIAVRCPRHTVARDLIDATGEPVSAPSANRSGRISPTSAAHAARELADAGDLVILDGGPCEVGLESTVLDLTGDVPRVLRPGSVTRLELRALLGTVKAVTTDRQAASPGTSPRHYAPRLSTELVEPDALADHLASGTPPAAVLCFDRERVPPPHHPIEMPQGAGEYARQLYDALHRADEMEVERIVIEAPPASNDVWKAILDRLKRATA